MSEVTSYEQACPYTHVLCSADFKGALELGLVKDRAAKLSADPGRLRDGAEAIAAAAAPSKKRTLQGSGSVGSFQRASSFRMMGAARDVEVPTAEFDARTDSDLSSLASDQSRGDPYTFEFEEFAAVPVGGVERPAFIMRLRARYQLAPDSELY